MLFCMGLLMKTMCPIVMRLKWIMLLVLLENVKMTLQRQLVGLMLMNRKCHNRLMNNCCSELLKHLRQQICLPMLLMPNFQAKKPRKRQGHHWHASPSKPQKGRRPWSFGHKFYALMKLKEANGNRDHARTKILLDW